MTRLTVMATLLALACCGDEKGKQKLNTPCTCPIDRWETETSGVFTYYAEEFTGDCEFLRDSFFDDDGSVLFGYCTGEFDTTNCLPGVSGLRKPEKGEAAAAGNATKKLVDRRPLNPGKLKEPGDMTFPPLPGATLVKSWLVTMHTDESLLIPVRLFLLLVPSPDAATPARLVGMGEERKPGGTAEFTVSKKYVTSLEPEKPMGNKHWEYDVRLGNVLYNVLTTAQDPGNPAQRLKIDSLDPPKGKVSVADTLIINGQNLGEQGFVTIAGKQATVMEWTPTKVKVKVAAAMVAEKGRKRVVVHNKAGDLDETGWLVEP